MPIHSLDINIEYLKKSKVWILIATLMLVSVAYFSPQQRLLGLNHLVQDFIVAHHSRPLTGEVLIVAIDDKSVAALGRWPWRRSLHATLLDKMNTDRPQAIGVDVLFTEPDQKYPQDDVALAKAITKNHAVLPILIQGEGASKAAIMPFPSLISTSLIPVSRLGHVNLNVDDDGVIRSIYLQESVANPQSKNQPQVWNHFSLALLAAAGKPLAPDLFKTSPNFEDTSHKIIVPYAGKTAYFKRVSYVDVVQDKVPAGTFYNKIVLVAATASGVGDQYATPTTNQSLLMPGVEIMANVVDGFLQHKRIVAATNSQNIALNLAFLITALLAFKLLSPLSALITTVLLALSLLGISYGMYSWAGLLLSPSAGALGLIVIYPLWSWQRLTVATRYLTNEFEFIMRENISLQAPDSAMSADFLDKRISALTGATKQLQGLHRLVVESINGLPDPVLVCDLQGNIKIANLAAARHFHLIQIKDVLLHNVLTLLASVQDNKTMQAFINVETIGKNNNLIEGEGRDAEGRDLLFKCAPILNGDYQHTGWIVSLVDISDMLKAERERDEAFRFITHDMRSPLSSIISLLDLHRLQAQSSGLDNQMLTRIAHYADNALALADDFMSLSSAKSSHYQLSRTDLSDILAQAVDNAWVLAHKRNITIEYHYAAEQPASALIDAVQIDRALTNIINNAVKFSLANSQVLCALSQQGRFWKISVTDSGLGMGADAQTRLFQPFSRLHKLTNPEIEGTGLGLAFVQAVVQKHGGTISVVSQVNQGSTFTILLPQ